MHPASPRLRAGNNYRGTSAIGAAIEVGFRLARHPDDHEARDRRFLRCFKSRPAPEPEDRWLRLHVEREQVFIEAAEPFVGEKEREGSHAPKRAELAPRLLAAAASPIAWPGLARAIDRSPKDGTARRLRNDLLKSGELVKLDDGRFVVPSDVAPAEAAFQGHSEGTVPGASTYSGRDPVAPAKTEPCRYPLHRPADYTGDGGQAVCGTCHPRVQKASG